MLRKTFTWVSRNIVVNRFGAFLLTFLEISSACVDLCCDRSSCSPPVVGFLLETGRRAIGKCDLTIEFLPVAEAVASKSGICHRIRVERAGRNAFGATM